MEPVMQGVDWLSLCIGLQAEVRQLSVGDALAQYLPNSGPQTKSSAMLDPFHSATLLLLFLSDQCRPFCSGQSCLPRNPTAKPVEQ